MRHVKIIKINLQESILIIDEPLNRIDVVIAMYSSHTNVVAIRNTFWHSNEEIEDSFKKELSLKRQPKITCCSGFGIEVM